MSEAPILDARTCRAARALLNWSSRRLAIHSGTAVRAIFELERGRPVDAESLRRLEAAFLAAGVAIIEEDGRAVGVRLAHGAAAT